MAKDIVFDVQEGEVLKEGKMLLAGMFKNQTVTEFPSAYALTAKGIWMEKKGMFSSKAVFAPYSDFKQFAALSGCCVLYQSKGNFPTNIYFDDINGAIEIISKYVPKLTI